MQNTNDRKSTPKSHDESKPRGRLRNILRRGGKFLLWASLILLTLLALLYVVIDWRGKRAWQQTQQMLSAAGEPTSLAEMKFPPQPDDDENYGAIPQLKYLALIEGDLTGEGPGFALRERLVAARLRAEDDDPLDVPPMGSPWFEQSCNLEKWAAYFVKYKSTQPGSSASETILNTLSVHREVLDGLRQGLDRPHARLSPSFLSEYDEGLLIDIPVLHCHPLYEVSPALALRAIAAIRSGDQPAQNVALAHDSLRAISRLAELGSSNGLLVEQLVAARQFQLLALGLWECQEEDVFSAEQWRVIQKDLDRIDIGKLALRAARWELIATSQALEHFDRWPDDGGTWLSPSTFDDMPIPTVKRMPSGFFAHNSATLATLHYEFVTEPLKREGVSGVIDAGEALEAALDDNQRLLPPDGILVPGLMPGYAKVFARIALTQATLEMARTACALERSRLDSETGSYPKRLTDLVPAYLATLPHDPMARNDEDVIRYRRNPDGGFRLWSVGMDRKDDHGEPGQATEKKKENAGTLTKADYQGDWVWTVKKR